MTACNDFLNLESIAKRFGEIAAVDEVSLRFAEPQMVALIGGNGAGKSTILRCIAGLVQPDNGSMSLCSKPYHPRNVRQARSSGVRLVSQELDIFPNMTVTQNYELHSGLPCTQSWESIDPNTLITNLSAQDAQWVILQGELGNQAQVFLLDEPTALLDEERSAKLLKQLRLSAASGKLVIVTTHKPGDLKYFDRWIFLHAGKVQTDLSDIRDAMAHYGAALPAHGLSNAIPSEKVSTQAVGAPKILVHRSATTGVTGANATLLFRIARTINDRLRSASHETVFIGPERRRDHLMPFRSLYDYVRLYLQEPQQEERLAETLRSFGLKAGRSFWEQSLGELSGGMQQKFLISLGLCVRADYRIFCDPLRGLDRDGVIQFGIHLKDSAAGGSGNLVFSQDLDFIGHVSEYVAAIDDDGEVSYPKPIAYH